MAAKASLTSFLIILIDFLQGSMFGGTNSKAQVFGAIKIVTAQTLRPLWEEGSSLKQALFLLKPTNIGEASKFCHH